MIKFNFSCNSYFYFYFYFYYNFYLYFYSMLDIFGHNCRPYQLHEKLNFIIFYSILHYIILFHFNFTLRKHHSEFRARRILNCQFQILQEILYRSIPRIREEFKGKNNTRNNIREWVRKRI